MKILFCTSRLSGGGAEKQMGYLIHELLSRRVDLHVVFLYDGPITYEADRDKVKWHHIKCFSNHDPMILVRLIKIIKDIKPDLVQSSLFQMDVVSWIACIITRTKWVFREANNRLSPDNRGLRGKTKAFIAKWADGIVANSQEGLDYWHSLLSETKIKCIKNGLPGHFSIAKEKIDLRFNITNPYILFAGRLVAQKNIDTIIEAYAKSGLNNEIKLFLCGNGYNEKDLRCMASKLDLTDQIRFLGYVQQEELLELMKGAWLYVNSSFFEGCPNTVMEAMASGCPIAVSDIPAHRSILNDNSAFFFEANDVDKLSSIFRKLNEKGELLEKAMASFRTAKQFNARRMAEDYVSFYNSVILEDKII